MAETATGMDGEWCYQRQCGVIQYYTTNGQMRDDSHASLFQYDDV